MTIVAAIILKMVDTIPLTTPEVSAERATGRLPMKQQSPSSTQRMPFSTVKKRESGNAPCRGNYPISHLSGARKVQKRRDLWQRSSGCVCSDGRWAS